MSRNARLVGMSACVIIVLSFALAHAPLAGQEKKPAKALKHLEVDLGGGVKMKLVYIEPGKFRMGSPKEEQGRQDNEVQRQVEITKGFFMGVFEVTQDEYEKVMGNNPSEFKGARLPVEQVSWDDALEFCKRLSTKEGKTIDLPTEAEWEYACRAGSTGPFHCGNSLSSKQANVYSHYPKDAAVKGSFLEKPAPVGSYEPNAFGLHDVHGNIWEWCKDWYKDDYYKESPLQDPQGPKTESGSLGRVRRGGSWGYPAEYGRSARRDNSAPSYRGNIVGFRVVVRLP
jgi:formylglycine-generating enzyme required for sulfatase activity